MTTQPKRPWFRFSLRTFLLVPVFVFLACGITIAIWPTPTDCGGNNPVMTQERVFLETVLVAAMDSPDHQFVITSATSELRVSLARCADDPALLVSTQPLRFEAADKNEVVIVCSEARTNRPRHRWENRVPKHAVGFADGHVELWTVEQYQSLDKSHLVSLHDLLSAKPNK